MAEGNGHTIGGIVGPRGLGQIERALHHRSDLMFVGAAVAGDSLLDFGWCILGKGQFTLCNG